MLPKLFFISILSSLLFTHSCNSQCLEHQKILLLQLKNELVFDSSRSTKLVQWNRTSNDCCEWYGVGCDGAGNVIGLHLDNESISGGIRDNSRLFGLEYLQKLNLAFNSFKHTPIPKNIHNLTYLTHLNLSYAGFGGQVPLELSSLRRLVSLDLSNNYRTENSQYRTFILNMKPLTLENPDLETILRNLTWLEVLHLDTVNITSSDERQKWSHIISSHLPNITSLSMCQCSLYGPLARPFWELRSLSALRLDLNDLSRADPGLFASFPNLITLSLLGCRLNGSFPDTIFNIPTMKNLDLSHNALLSGSIPPFTRTGSFKSIRLSFTNFSGAIPASISKLKSLSEMDLSNCRFVGSIPSTFANLTRLTYVDLSHNFFTGSLPSSLFEGLSNLVYLNLAYNSFSGNIPQSLFRLPSLSGLHLRNNRLTGTVEEFFPTTDASNIATLDLSSNRLGGHVPRSFFELQSLEYLLLSENMFTDFSIPNQLPEVAKRSDLTQLDLSNNRIAGELPSWIWGIQVLYLNLSLNHLTHMQEPFDIRPSLRFLDLNSNRLRGKLHLPIPLASQLMSISLSNNSLNGSIPPSLCNATQLEFLDLSVNKLSGSIPSCLSKNLLVLNLKRNILTGHILDNFSLPCSLRYFDLSNNSVEGNMPKSLESCSRLEFVNVGNNILDGAFPCIRSSILRVLVLHSNRFSSEVKCHQSWPNLQILDVSSNDFTGRLEESMNVSSWLAMVIGSEEQQRNTKFGSYHLGSFGLTITMKGIIVQLVKIWPEFNAIDFSSNSFEGGIPNEIGDLSSLHQLNFSHNTLDGGIPKSFGRLRKLESLDLSSNRLTGAIPAELAQLTFLSVLNVSYNRLVGEIPSGRQLQTFPADSFEGNAGLCGFNINVSCSRPDLAPPAAEEEEEEIEWAYVCAAVGYVVGLGSLVWLLVFCRSFRYEYFGKIDEVVEGMFDARKGRKKHAPKAEHEGVGGIVN